MNMSVKIDEIQDNELSQTATNSIGVGDWVIFENIYNKTEFLCVIAAIGKSSIVPICIEEFQINTTPIRANANRLYDPFNYTSLSNATLNKEDIDMLTYHGRYKITKVNVQITVFKQEIPE